MANLFKTELGGLGPFLASLNGGGMTEELFVAVGEKPALGKVMVTAALAALAAVNEKVVEVFTALVKYLQPSFEELSKVFDWVNPDYAKARFEPIERCKSIVRTAGDVVFQYFRIDRQMTTKKILEAMDAVGLRPALYEELLAFASKYPDEQRRHLIAALGSVARFGGHLHVAYLSGDDRERDLSLSYGDPSIQWDANWFFLAVSK